MTCPRTGMDITITEGGMRIRMDKPGSFADILADINEANDRWDALAKVPDAG